MAQEAGSIGLPGVGTDPASLETASPVRPPGIIWLVVSLVPIALGAIVFAFLLAACFILFLYLHDGRAGVAEFYEEFWFDLRLKTLISAVVVGALYIGVAVATMLVAFLHGRRHWPSLVAWSAIRASWLLVLLIVLTTLSYGSATTLILTMTRDHHVLVAGNTDVPLLVAITANLVIFAPAAEELLFRGWLYTGLRARLPFWITFLVTGALFAATHWGAGTRRILLVLPLAAALGVLREVTGSIKPTVALHSVYNLVIIGLTLLES